MTTKVIIAITLWLATLFGAFAFGEYKNAHDGCIYAGGDYIDKICVNRDRVNDVEFIFNKEEGMQQVFWSFSDKIQPDNSFVISQLIDANGFEEVKRFCSNITTYNFD